MLTKNGKQSLQSKVFVLYRDIYDVFIEKRLIGVERKLEAVKASVALWVW
jgi:hypothetical protein